jgi:hypothetical protein
LARRIQGLEDEIVELDQRIEALLAVTAPELMARFGVGPARSGPFLLPFEQPFQGATRGSAEESG